MTTLLKVYLVEDEPLARDELKYLLLRTGQTEIVGEADRIDEALEEIRQLSPDVVFLDVHLARGTGLELARELNGLANPPVVVFATAYDEHALQAFDLNAFDYVLKPFDEDRVRQTIDKITRWLPQRGNNPVSQPRYPGSMQIEQRGKLAVTADERIVLLDMHRILSVCAEGGRVTIRSLDGDYSVDSTLVELERKLGSRPFFRAHRAYIVNLDHVKEIEPWFNGTYNLILGDGSKVPVSRNYAKDLRQALGF